MHVVGADQRRLGVARRAQQRRLDMHHAQLEQVLAGQLVHRQRAVHQALLREHGQRHDTLAALQVDGDALAVAHAGGQHLDHLGLLAVLAEAQQVGLQRRAELRDARADAVLGGIGLHLVEIAPVRAHPHQLGLAERDGGLEHLAVHGDADSALLPLVTKGPPS